MQSLRKCTGVVIVVFFFVIFVVFVIVVTIVAVIAGAIFVTASLRQMRPLKPEFAPARTRDRHAARSARPLDVTCLVRRRSGF
jgi:hypothetical protein